MRETLQQKNNDCPNFPRLGEETTVRISSVSERTAASSWSVLTQLTREGERRPATRRRGRNVRIDSIFELQKYTTQNAKKRAAAGADDVLA